MVNKIRSLGHGHGRLYKHIELSVCVRDTMCDGLGCMLMQKGEVVAYSSRQLKNPKKNYLTYDLDLAAVIFALKSYHYAMTDSRCSRINRALTTFSETQSILLPHQGEISKLLAKQ